MAAPARRPQPGQPRLRADPRPRPRAVGATPAPGIRWDRLSRVALLAVLVVMAGLYVGPLRTWWTVRGEAAARRTQVERLRHENVVLRERRAALSHTGAIEVEARRLGMVKPGERPFVVRGLPAGR